MDETLTKKCLTCEREKDARSFYKKSGSNKLWGTCKECINSGKRRPRHGKPMNYRDYLEQQGLYKYYLKNRKYF